MSEKYPLNETLSPIDREGRNRLNDNWTRIMAYFDHVQLQIKALAGGHEVDELIARLEQAIANAETDLQNYIAQVDTTVQEAIDANNTATQDAIAKNNTALQIALDKVADKLLEVNQAIENADTSAEGANAAKQGALDATAQAKTAISNMQSLINNTVHRGIWNNTTQYFKNNMATYNGSTFIALQDNIDKAPPTLPTQSNTYWSLFAEKGATGATGPQGLPGKDGKDGTGVNIIGSLASEAELPQTGSPGDAYMIGGDLYVWQANLNNWKNVGPIQGPEGKSAYDLAMQNGFVGTMEEWLESLKGETGPPGPEGPQGLPGKDADLTEVNQEITNIKQTVTDNKTEVTEHLAESNINAHKIGNIDGLQTALEEIADSQMTVNGKAIEYNGDYNLLRKSGWYNGSQSWGAKNLPPTGPASYLVEVIAWSGYNEGSVTQFARSSNKPEVTWFRQGFANGNWNPWTRVTDNLYNIYVDPVNGLDEDGKGWSNGANAYKTLGYALGKLPRLSGYETTLTLAAGTYSTLNLSNYRGGLLTVRGAGATTVIDWVMFSHIDNLQLRDFNAVMGLDLRSVNNFSIQNVNSPYGTDGHGVYCLASSGMISMSTYSSKTSGAGIKLDNGSNVVLDTVSGSGNKIGIDVELSICRRRASSITGTTPTRALNGGQIL